MLEPGQPLADIDARTRVIGIIVPNGLRDLPHPQVSWAQFRVPVGEIETRTGLHFFTALPPAVRDALLDKSDGSPIQNRSGQPFARVRRAAPRTAAP